MIMIQDIEKNARIFCDLYDGSTRKESRYTRDSRGIAHKSAEKTW